MANLLEVEIKPVITIDDDAFTILRLLELFCKNEEMIDKANRYANNEIYLSLVKDEEGKENDND